jgi:hypothetical protein
MNATEAKLCLIDETRFFMVEKYKGKWLVELSPTELEIAKKAANDLFKATFGIEIKETDRKMEDKGSLSRWVSHVTDHIII